MLDPRPEELELEAMSSSHIMFHILMSELCSLAFCVVANGTSVALVCDSCLAVKCQIFDISSMHSTTVSGVVCGMFVKLHTRW
jgi:hypothetical protein